MSCKNWSLSASGRVRFRLFAAAYVLFAVGCGSSSSQPPPDTTPPTAPTNLTTTAASPAQINLSWTASTDNVGVTGYQVERCQGNNCASFSQIATPSATTYNDSGLTGSTSYSYRVRATDAAGNLSAYSSSSSATTPAPTFTAPANLAATAVSSTQINLTWTAGTETGGTISQYLVERCQGASCASFTQVATSSSAAFSDSGLAASTSYSYRVRATDASNNLSAYSNTATATTSASGGSISVTLTPHQGGITTAQTIPLNATVMNDVGSAGVTWSTTGGTLSGQTTSAASFASASAGAFTVTAKSVADPTKSATAIIGVTGLTGVFTYHNDLARDGVNTQEFALTPSNVKSGFGKLFSCPVDGEMYAQPLWVANLTIGGGTHNVVFAATENDSVFAFDADASPCKQYWMKSFLSPGVTPVPPSDTGEAFDINTQIGITGTPVIDPATQTLYVVAKTKEGTGNYHQRLHALSLVDGSEKFSGPVDLTQAITVNGTGDQGDGKACNAAAGKVPFCPLEEGQRAGLALVSSGNVYVAWASHGDNGPYHGWIMSFNAANLQQAPVIFNDSPNGGQGGIWMSGGAPAFDSSNNIFVITGNGDYDGITEFGDSFLKLNPSLVVQDWFTPNVQAMLAAQDLDLGSGGAVVLVDLPSSSVPHVLIGGGKGLNQVGTMYVVNRDTGSMGKNATPDNVVQSFDLGNMIYSTAAFWQNTMYIAAVGGQLSAYAISPTTSLFSVNPTSQSAHFYNFPGATPSVSSQSTTNGIVWALDTDSTTAANASGSAGPAILFAYDATNLANELWDSTQGTGNAAGDAVKFAVPVIANGKVYVGTKTELTVYGLLP